MAVGCGIEITHKPTMVSGDDCDGMVLCGMVVTGMVMKVKCNIMIVQVGLKAVLQ